MTIRQIFKRFFVCLCLVLVAMVVDAKMYGLFYGVDGYGLTDPENDVTALADLYRNNGGQVILVRGDGVKRNNILTNLKKQCDACTKDDIIVFVYSGHGDKGLIQCGNEFIYFSEIKRILSACKAGRKLIIIDSCYSGSFASDKTKINGKNVILISASRKNEESHSVVGADYSIFFKQLIDGLEGKADSNKDERVVAKELYEYLKSDKTMQFVGQHPTMKGKFDDNILLYTYKNGKEKAPLKVGNTPIMPSEGNSNIISSDEISVISPSHQSISFHISSDVWMTVLEIGVYILLGLLSIWIARKILIYLFAIFF